ncbi:MAG: TIGR03668 family PPOX class F420-dependent oxidoreductase [Nitrososphaerales archaeon]
MYKLEPKVTSKISKARVARLSTIDNGQPHVVPVVFIFDRGYFFIPLDKKSKSVKPEKLRRVRNIVKNPMVALLIDEYKEDWSKLFFIMVVGKARIIGKEQGQVLARVHKLLLTKYPQYKCVGIGKSCVMIDPQKVIFWKSK